MAETEANINEKPLAKPKPHPTLWRLMRKLTLKAFRNLIGLVLTILIFAIILLQFPFFQSVLVKQLFQAASEQLKFKIETSSVYINFFTGNVNFYKLSIRDLQDKQMIYADKLSIRFNYNNLLKDGDVYLQDVKLQKATINLRIDAKTGLLNIDEFIETIDSLTSSKEKKRKPSSPTKVSIKHATISDTYFAFSDERKPPFKQEGYFDPTHFGIDELNSEIHNLLIIGDSINVDIKGLRGIEYQSKLKVKELTTHFRFSESGMAFQNLYCATNNSIIKDSIAFSYKHPRDLSDFVEKVDITAHLDSSVIDTDDLAVFAPAVKVFRDKWRIKGDFKGRVNNFTLKKMDLGFGKQSQLLGDATFSGLPEVETAFMDLRFKRANLQAAELNPYIDQPEVRPILEKLGLVSFQGKVSGFFNDFVATGDFQSALGSFNSDLNLKIKPNEAESYYKGSLKTNELQLGEILGIPDIQKVDFDGTIEGKGFTPATANFDLDAKINRLGFRQYDYKNIEVKGKLSRLLFAGNMEARDENFNFDIDGTIDFNKDLKNPQEPTGKLDLITTINRLSLKPLGFMPVETVISGKVITDLRGLSLDELIGDARIENLFMEYNDKGLNVNYLEFLSFQESNGNRVFDIISDFANIHLRGNFLFSRLFTDLEELVYEYNISFQNRQDLIAPYYKKKNKLKDAGKYSLDYELKFKNINPIVQIFDEKVFVSGNTHLKGKFNHGKANTLNLYSESNIDSLFYGTNRLYDILIDVNTSKLANNAEILAEGTVSSGRQKWGDAQTENLLLNSVWGDNQIDFNLKIKQAESTNAGDLQGFMKFMGDTTLISFLPSDFKLLNKKWLFAPKNQIVFSSQGIFIDNINLFKKESPDSQLALNGAIADSSANPLRLDIRDFDLLTVADLAGYNMRGVLNAEVDFEKLKQSPYVKGQLGIENLMIENVLIGDVDGNMQWSDSLQNLGLDVVLYRRGRYILDLFGSVKPNAKEALNLTLDFKKTDLEILEPFAKEFISKLKGVASGKLSLQGSLLKPAVRGTLKVQNAQFRLNYLNTFYNLEGEVAFKPGEIDINNTILFDELTNPAIMQAKLFHDGFKNFFVRANADFYDFQLLNLPETPNSLYYGEAYATGDMKIEGFLSNLAMTVNAKSRKGTKIFLPLDGYQEVSDQDYIRFVHPTDAKADSIKIKRIDLGGMKLNFNLEVTPDADFNIIFDKRAGDVIRGKGKGNIEMKIDTEGEFAMFGEYEIQEGKYNFTLAIPGYDLQLINKGFNIQRGSTVIFNGDPYESVMNIRAIYSKNVSLKSLVDNTNLDNNTSREVSRFYPVKATMDLKGKLMSPEIKLGIDLTEAKNMTLNSAFLQSALLLLESQILANEQVRNQQVFSLLILNRLSAINSFSGVGGGAGGSLSELLSNQFSNWISQVDENLELSVNFDPSNINTFQMRFSYNLLDGRLRITRDGGFTNSRNQTDFTSLLGDWTLEYLLSPSGRYRIKTYNRTNLGQINSVNLNNGAATTFGISLAHTATFNHFGEIFKSSKPENAELQPKTNILIDSTCNTLENEPIQFKKEEDKTIPIEVEKEKPSLQKSNEKMPLPKRNDKYMPRVIAQNNTNTPNNLPSNNSQNEEDEDNEPMPEKYRKKEEVPQNKTSPNKTNSNKSDFPLKHRFDSILVKQK